MFSTNYGARADLALIAKVERRAGSRRPQLSDLRESGAIEADADLVLFISRDDSNATPGGDCTTEITVAKHRNGATGGFGLAFARQFTKFRDLSGRQP